MLNAGVYKNTEVATSNRVKLIVMLYEGAINFLRIAKERMAVNDIEGKAAYLDKSTAIISELSCSLDNEAGKEIAANLERLYNYMISQISEANIKNDTKPIDNVLPLLGELKSAWDELAKKETEVRTNMPRGENRSNLFGVST